MGGRGGASGLSPKGSSSTLFETDKKGVKTYSATKEGQRAFNELSKNYVHMQKAAFVDKPGMLPQTVKKTQLWDFLKKNDINDFKVLMPKGSEKRTLQQLEDYGYHVIAKSGYNSGATEKHHEVSYVVAKKEMQYLGLDFKIKKYYKRGWKG